MVSDSCVCCDFQLHHSMWAFLLVWVNHIVLQVAYLPTGAKVLKSFLRDFFWYICSCEN